MPKCRLAWCLFLLICVWVERLECHRVPANIKDLALPHIVMDDDQVTFALPEKLTDLLATNPRRYLTGACLETYKQYSDGERMHNLTESILLDNDMYNMIIEYAVYNYLIGDCSWIEEVWSHIRHDWKYVNAEHAGIFDHLQQNLVKEIVGWFAYWIGKQMEDGINIYPDGIIQWKTIVIQQFLSLKRTGEEAPGGGGGGGGGGGSKHGGVEVHCERINPVRFFGDRYEELIDFLQLTTSLDKPKHHGGGGGGSTGPSGYTAQFSLFAEACTAVCIRIGAGLTWNYIDGDVHIHWMYGMGSIADEANDVAVRAQISVYCEEAIRYGDVYNVGYLTDHEMTYDLMYTPEGDFVGVSFTVGFLSEYSPTDRDFHFYYQHSQQIAKKVDEDTPLLRGKVSEANEIEMNIGSSKAFFIIACTAMGLFTFLCSALVYWCFCHRNGAFHKTSQFQKVNELLYGKALRSVTTANPYIPID